MAHNLYRLVEKIKTEPLLVTEEGLKTALNYLESRNYPAFEMSILGGRPRQKDEIKYVEESQTGVISVHGPLSYIEYQPLCGEEQTSYQGMEAQFDALVEAGAKTIVFDFDTPGGIAYSVFETAKYFRDVADRVGVTLLGYVDGTAYSAGYALISAMDMIIANPDARVGSIGVLVHLQNINRAKKAAGIDDTYLFAGKNKIPFDSDGSFRKEFLEKIEKDVESTYIKFVDHVAEMTGLDKQTIINTQADTYNAEAALDIGLIDATMTREEFFSYLADVSENSKQGKGMQFSRKFLLNNPEDNSESMSTIDKETAEQLQVQLAESRSKQEALSNELTSLKELNTELTQKLSSASTELESIKAEREKEQKEAAQKKLEQRKTELAKVVAEDKVEALFASTESLDDESFNTVLEGLKVGVKAEEEREEFKETGFSAEGDSNLQEEKYSKVSEIIDQKFNK